MSRLSTGQAAGEVVPDRVTIAEFLGFIAGRDMVRGRTAPVIGAPGGPGEAALPQEGQQGFVGITGDIRGKAQLAAGPEDAVQRSNEIRLDEAPLLLSPLRPGIREED